MTRGAFLVGGIDKESKKLVAVDIFSEETPTMTLKLHPVTLTSSHASTFADAVIQLREILRRDPAWTWLLPLIKATARNGGGL